MLITIVKKLLTFFTIIGYVIRRRGPRIPSLGYSEQDRKKQGI